MKNKILLFLAVILIVLFPLSFFIEKKANGIKTYETAFLNPKNTESILKISIFDKESKIELSLQNDIWSGTFLENDSSEKTVFLAEQQTVKNFIKNLSSVRKLYVSSENQKILNNSNWIFKVSYELKDGKITEILFGKNDISKTKRFLKLPEKKEIYKTEANFESFLTTNPDFWIYPDFVPLVNGKKLEVQNIQKLSFVHNRKRTTLIPSTEDFSKKAETLLSLRHGKLSSSAFSKIQSDTLEIEADENKTIYIKIQPKDESKEDFLVQYEFNENYYVTEISAWTYNRILEIFDFAE